MAMKTIAVPAQVYDSIWKAAYPYRRLRQICNHADRLEWDYWAYDLLASLTEAQKQEAQALVEQRVAMEAKIEEIDEIIYEHADEQRSQSDVVPKQQEAIAALDTAEHNALAMLRLGLCRSHERGVTGEGLENWLRQNAVLDGLIKTLAENAEARSTAAGALEQAIDRLAFLEKALADAEATKQPLKAFTERTKHELKVLLGYAAVHAQTEDAIAEAMKKHSLKRDRCEQLIKHAAANRLKTRL